MTRAELVEKIARRMMLAARKGNVLHWHDLDHGQKRNVCEQAEAALAEI